MTTIVLIAGALLGWALTGTLCRYARSLQLLDHPNERSSHTRPTPRGGGAAFVAAFVATSLVLWLGGAVPAATLVQLLGPPLLVAAIGLLDDRRPVPARWRLLTHALASAWAVWLLGGAVGLETTPLRFVPGWLVAAIAATYLVWMINLYNFMDGIDGIAGTEAITVVLGGALCWWIATRTSQWPLPALFASCLVGFLAWNLPPARIFMGDVGSGFVGMTVGILSLWTARQSTDVFWCWLILLGCFMVDATVTLLRRVQRGEKFYEAHRNHAYQYASRVHGSHRKVTLAVGAINLAWLLPIALLVALGKLSGPAATLAAYAPLVWLAYRYKAGDRAGQAA